MRLSEDQESLTLSSAFLTQITSVRDGRTDRQTDRHTDRPNCDKN